MSEQHRYSKVVGPHLHSAIKEEMSEHPVGTKLPPEDILAEQRKVDQSVMQRVLGELKNDGLIARNRVGEHVVVRKLKDTKPISFTEQVRSAGMEPSTEVLTKDQIMASEAEGRVREAFLLDDDQVEQTPIYRIDRLRCGDDQPLARQILYLLAEDFNPDFLKKEDFTGSIFEIYRRHHRWVVLFHERVQARPAIEEELELLKMRDLPAQQHFVQVRDRISYDLHNRPLEVLKSIDRGYSFQIYQYLVRTGRNV